MPVNPLLQRLVDIYRGEEIRYPALKEVTLAQWMLESGKATSDLAKLHYNFGGLKWRKEMAGIAKRVSYVAHDGEDFYCKFATIESFVAGYWMFLNRAPYSGWEGKADSGEDFIRFIGPIYTPSVGYADKVLNLVPQARALLEAKPVTVAGTGTVAVNKGPAVATAAKPKKDLGTIVIDPGHGGTASMPGSDANHAISISGVKEKKLTLDFSMILRDEILAGVASNESVKVVLTRDTDINLPGSQRAGMALKHKAKLFLCIHFNGDKSPKPRGPETYYRAPATNMNLQADMEFADKVQEALFKSLFAMDPRTINRGIKPDNAGNPNLPGFGVLNDKNLGNDQRPDPCRAAYIEAEFITNPGVEKLLISGPDAIANRTSAMRAVAKAVIDQMRAI